MDGSLLVCAIAALVFASAPADGAGPAAGEVKFALALGSQHAPVAKTCMLVLTEPVNGFGLLQIGIDQLCITGYHYDTAGGGHDVKCLDDVCQAPGVAWALYVNGTIACPPRCPLDQLVFDGEENVTWVFTDRASPYVIERFKPS